MTEKQMLPPSCSGSPPLTHSPEISKQLKYSAPTDEDMNVLASTGFACSTNEAWSASQVSVAERLESLTKLRPFLTVAQQGGSSVAYVTVERDGPVPGAAYLRKLVVRNDARRQGIGLEVLSRAMWIAREMNRKTLALRVDPANSAAVSFYRKGGFTTVATVVSRKSGKLRLLMSRDL